MSPELLKQIEAAEKAGHLADQTEPVALSARYIPAARTVELQLKDGRLISIEVDNLQGLQGATDEQLSQVKLNVLGSALYWDQLDVDFGVVFLLEGIYGTRAWMAKLGRQGGKAKSLSKAVAARNNGKKGGRPPKHKIPGSQPQQGRRLFTERSVRLKLPRDLHEQMQQASKEYGLTLEAYLVRLIESTVSMLKDSVKKISL